MSIFVCDGLLTERSDAAISMAFGADAKEAFWAQRVGNSDGIRGMGAGSTRKMMVRRYLHPGHYR
jgi:hypothetical protein